jgi:hypothetical protein
MLVDSRTKAWSMSYLNDEDGLKFKIMSNRYISAIAEWWSNYSYFLILPAAIIAFCVAVYLMFHDVL